DGGRWGFEHTPAGRLTATIDPLGARTEITHDTAGEVATVTDPLDRTTQSFHDDLGHLAATVLPDGRRWEYTHDALSRLVAVTDPDGARWEYTHDVMGQLTRQTDPTGRSWTTGYSKDHLETWQYPEIPDPPKSVQVTDRIGRVIAFTRGEEGGTHHTKYDACGRPIEYTSPDGGVTTLTRDLAGRVLQIKHPDGSVTTYSYDPVTGKLTGVTDAVGNTTTFITDADNHLIAEIDPAGGEIRYSHDSCGRITTAEHPVHGRSTWQYDLAGRVIATWSRFLGKRRFHYDAAGQLIEAVDALGRVTRYDYDRGGRATTITDPLGNVTHRTFNHLNLNTTETDPLGRVKKYRYDPAGRLIGHERATGEHLEWSFDGAGNIHQIIANGTIAATHRHDYRAGLLTVDDVTDPDEPVTHRLRWDPSGRLVEQTRDQATTKFGYDLLGRCVAVTAPNGDVTRYHYNPLGLCTRIDTPAGSVAQTFNPAGQITEAHTPTGRHTWDYVGGQVSRHRSETSNGTHVTVIERDEDGRITAITRDGRTTRYRHDPAGQLVEARTPTTNLSWIYDDAGRLVEEHDGDAVTRYVHDAAGQLLERHSPSGTTHYDYNRAGKRISEHGPHGQIEYTWSALGWLTHINGPHGATSLHVNALGELARVNDADLYWNTSSGQPLQIDDRTITITSVGTSIGPQWSPSSWRTGRLDTATGWDAAPTTSVDGVSITSDGGLHISGLEWLHHRVFQPDTRTFLTPDPLDPVTGSPTAGNPYHYANNNPLQAQDPQGLRPVTDQELAEYTHRNHTAGFWERNGTAVGGATLFVIGAGVAVLFPGAGTIIGGALMGAGTSMISQGLQNPGQPPDLVQVGIGAAFGAIVPGGGLSLMGKLAFGTGTGAVGGFTEALYTGWRDGLSGSAYWKNAATNTVVGAGTGGVATGAGMIIGKGVSAAKSGVQSLFSRGVPDVAPAPAAPSAPVPPGWGVTDSGLAVPPSAGAPRPPAPPPTGPVPDGWGVKSPTRA
ncbi:hypothetical protein EII34_12330, partial [Arachnia propionica]